MHEFSVKSSRSPEVPGIIILKLSGTVTTENIGAIHAEFDRIEQEDANFVVADVESVEGITSSVIGEMMGWRLSLAKRDGDLVLAGPSEPMRELILALGVNKIFRLFKDVRGAVRYFGWEYRGQIDRFDFAFPSALSYVPPVRQFVRRIARQKGYGEKDAFRIETIIDEICNNAVEHGSAIGDNHVDVQFSIDSRKVEINVINTCSDDSVETVKRMANFSENPNKAEDQMRGRGLALVKMLSSDFKILDSENGTCVRVTKIRED